MGYDDMLRLAEEGSLPHILAFADINFSSGDFAQALYWYRRAARAGDSPHVDRRITQCERCLAMTPQELSSWREACRQSGGASWRIPAPAPGDGDR